METTAKMERLAELKLGIKGMDAEVKQLQAEIIAEQGPEKMKTEWGTLTLASRTNWGPIDSEMYISTYGLDAFRKAATISVAGVKKAFGEAGLTSLDTGGFLNVKSISQYYSLRK